MLGLYLAMVDTDEGKSRFEELYYMYRGYLYQVAESILEDESCAEDAVQEAFLSLAKNFDRISPMNHIGIRNYLIIVVRNVSFRIYKRGRKEVSSDELQEVVPSLEQIEADVESSDLQKRLVQLLQSLDQKYGDVLMLKYFYDMKEREIAEALGITLENVKIRVHRGKQMIKKKIIAEGYYDGTSV